MTGDNPLLTESGLPYSLPDFARILPPHYLPALARAFAEHLAEIAEIGGDTAPPTFENTARALERSGALLDRVTRTFHTVSAAHATPEIRDLDDQIAPQLAEHADRIDMDAAVFARLDAVHARRGDLGLAPVDLLLLERRHARMRRAGAGLGEDDRARLAALNRRLAELQTAFGRHLLDDAATLAVRVSEEEMAGLDKSQTASAIAAARARDDHDGGLLGLPQPTLHPLLARLERREVRARVLGASLARGRRGGDNDNRQVVREIAALRAERAQLLGFASHAAYVTADETAGCPEAVRERIRALAAPTARNVARERAEIAPAADADGIALAAHDVPFYRERIRADRDGIDVSALRPWFAADRVLTDGVFFAATRLYGVRFAERVDLPGYHEDVRFFDVVEEDGSPVGLYVPDLFTRETKRGGAWMNAIVAQSDLRGTLPVVVNTLNVAPPAPGEPALLGLGEVETLFHEFGHALHGLFARVPYPTFAGTAVGRDVVEFPSQVNEMWAFHPDVLPHYARHVETGAPLPAGAAEALEAAPDGQGHATSEYLQAAWLDQAWHALGPAEARAVTDIAGFEARALAEVGLEDELVPPRYHSTMFRHIFAGAYSAAYYAYIWAEVPAADAAEWFAHNGGLTRENGERFRRHVLAVGGSVPARAAFRAFRGRDAELGPLLRSRGLGG
ncbi:M3 family metallopeptidase [Microbacterium sp. ZXX196]|uniref:M3 family metallopeptidase n=1 Tax=Microbacterium sp. ZXX196 TaxID=2609291 RepID=UPI0012B922EA|nr:M3 family metallopeptidase [Microbacterium sp. ZXX196]MTE23749.1 M3 family peptidase [Microbacterium sp. ZXX196]